MSAMPETGSPPTLVMPGRVPTRPPRRARLHRPAAADLRHRCYVLATLAAAVAALYAIQAAIWPHAAVPRSGWALAWSWAALLWTAAMLPAAAELAGLLTHRYPRHPGQAAATGIPVCFRIVSRGLNTEVLRGTILAIRAQLTATPLFPYTIEVVTDTGTLDRDYMPAPGPQLAYLTVPASYRTPRGTLYKARSLHYALGASPITPGTWIVHCDEETRPTASAVAGIARLITEEHGAARPRIGQGTILYHRNWSAHPFLTLADAIRTGSDMGRGWLSMRIGLPLFGLHGSWIVVRSDVEAAAGFDVGPAGSLAEDSWWGLTQAQAGTRCRWVDGYMTEQCPETARDFMRQRRRWANGMTRAVARHPAPWRYKAVMALSIGCWLLAPVAWIYTLTHFGVGGYVNPAIRVFANLSFATYITSTLAGLRVNMTAHGITGLPRRAGITALWLVLMPAFGLMESAAVGYAAVRPAKTFEVIAK